MPSYSPQSPQWQGLPHTSDCLLSAYTGDTARTIWEDGVGKSTSAEMDASGLGVGILGATHWWKFILSVIIKYF